MALQALFSGLVVALRQISTDKVAAPLDDDACADGACETVEAPFAHTSSRLARGELAGVVRAFTGCAAGDGVGLDDLLSTRGQADLATRTATAFELATASLEAIPDDDLAVSIADEEDSVRAAEAALTSLLAIVEDEVAPALELDSPPRN